MKRHTATAILAVCTMLGASSGLRASAAAPGYASQEKRTIVEVTIRGNIRVPESTIRYYIKTVPGQPFDEGQLRVDYQALLSSGLFSNVRLLTETRGPQQVAVIFEVTEPPVIGLVEFAGLRAVKESDILDHLRDRSLSLLSGARLDETRLMRAVNEIRQFLQLRGFPLAKATVSRQPTATNVIDLKFTVEEGPRARIGLIEFEGNTIFSSKELRDALRLTSPSSFWSGLRGRNLYLEDRLEYDIRANVLPKYQSRGYIFARTEKPRVDLVEAKTGGVPGIRRERLEYRITIRLIEGEQFRYGSFRVDGVEKVDRTQVVSSYEAKPGEIVDFVALTRANEQVKRLYGNLGFLDMELIPEMRPRFEQRTVDLTIRILEGGRYLVRFINFAGNERTRDKVLRRELILQERDVFNADRLDVSLLKLTQLDIIEPVAPQDYTLTKDQPNEEVDVLIKVRERDPHAINLTGGIGGISGSYIGFTYQSKNFRGLGQTLETQVEVGSRASTYSLALTDPHFRDSNMMLSYQVFHRRLQFDSFGLPPGQGVPTTFSLFSQRSTGFQVVSSRPVSSFSRLGVSYSLDTNKIYDIREDFRSFAIAQLILLTTGGTIDEALTGIIRSQVTPFWTYDTRNRYFGATKGTRLTVQIPIAGGPLGGRINVVHPFLEYQRFIPDRLFTASRNTWAFRAQLQHIFSYGTLPNGSRKPVPFLERIYFGGEYNLRGFDLRSIGPVAIHRTLKLGGDGKPILDPITGLPTFNEQPVTVGGDTGIVLTAEYRIPIYGPLQLIPFVDTGTSTIIRKRDLQLSGGNADVSLLAQTNNVWRLSTGAEIQFLIPGVNQPFRLILAVNPLRLNTTARVGGQNLVFSEPRTNVKFSVGYSF